MTTVWLQDRSAWRRVRVASKLLGAGWVLFVLGLAAVAQEPPKHWLHAGALPPGAIGSLRLVRGGPLSGYFQPVQVRVPQGTRIALAVESSFTEPVEGNALAGLLIGSVYRLRVTDIPSEPGAEVFPTIELIDRLYPPPGLALRFPIPIELTEEELRMAARGVFITRVIYVEDPLQALPVREKDGHTQWFEAAHGDDPLVTADRIGRPIAILRLGARYPIEMNGEGGFTYGMPPIEIYDESMVPPDETLRGGWPTYRLPCDDRLPCPACTSGSVCLGDANCFECNACNFIGPPDEYICDGGDDGMPVGVRADWTIDGLEEEDTIAHYDTLDGEVVVQPSNRVCLYAPRFAAVRRAIGPRIDQQNDVVGSLADELALVGAHDAQEPATSIQRHAVHVEVGEQPVSVFRQRQQVGELKLRVAVLEDVGRVAPYANISIVRSGVLENHEKAWLAERIETAHTWTGDQAVQVIVDNLEMVTLVGEQQVGEIFGQKEPDRPRLRLCKLASTGNAQPGQVVEFTLRYDNIGDQEIGNVTIVDNLSPRLEYVADSAKSTRQAEFVTEPNETGSLVLRWEIKEPLGPGEGGVLQFQTTVR